MYVLWCQFYYIRLNILRFQQAMGLKLLLHFQICFLWNGILINSFLLYYQIEGLLLGGFTWMSKNLIFFLIIDMCKIEKKNVC